MGYVIVVVYMIYGLCNALGIQHLGVKEPLAELSGLPILALFFQLNPSIEGLLVLLCGVIRSIHLVKHLPKECCMLLLTFCFFDLPAEMIDAITNFSLLFSPCLITFIHLGEIKEVYPDTPFTTFIGLRDKGFADFE